MSLRLPRPPRRGSDWLPTCGIGAAVLLLVALVAVPLLALGQGAAEQGWATLGRTLGDRETGEALAHTAALAIPVTISAVTLGAGLAVAFDRAMLAAPWAWRLALSVPLLVPQFVLTLSWTQAYGPGGLSERLSGPTFPGLYGPVGIGVLLTAEAVPLAWLVVSAGLAVRREPDLERAARVSGAGPWLSFLTVDLPLLRAPLLAAAALVFAGVVNSFAVPQVLGSSQGFHTLATLVYQRLSLAVGPDAFGQLSVLALLMVLLVLLAVATADRGLRGGADLTVRMGSGGSARAYVFTRVSLALMAGVAAYVLVVVVAPMLALVLASITRAPGLAPVPANWGLAGYRAVLTGPAATALGHSLGLAVAAAAVVTAMAALVLGVGGQARSRLGTVVTLGFAIPGSALAVGVLIAYGGWLRGSILLILLAYVAKLWAVGHRALSAGADRLAPELLRAGRASGADAVMVLRTVTAPLMATAVATSAALVALFAMHELTMSSILYGPDSTTYAVVVLDLQQLGDVGGAAAAAVVLTVPLLVLLTVGAGLMWRRQHRRTVRPR